MKLTGRSTDVEDCQDSLFVAARTEESSADMTLNMTENAGASTPAVVNCDLAMREYRDTDDGLVEKATLFCPALNSEFALSVTTQVLQRL